MKGGRGVGPVELKRKKGVRGEGWGRSRNPQRYVQAIIGEKQRGGGKVRGGKSYHKPPPQKRFWTPPLMIRFPPPFVHAMSFSLEETGTDQTNPTF